MAWITPWLSDFMMKWTLEKPLWMANKRPSSMATNSAHPMLQPSRFHPGDSFQESHWPSRTIPMPHEEEASTQNSIGEAGGGLVRNEPQKSADSWARHQLISEKTPGVGVLRTKGDEKKLKDATKQEREGKCERPSGTASEQCTRVPTTDSTSFFENF